LRGRNAGRVGSNRNRGDGDWDGHSDGCGAGDVVYPACVELAIQLAVPAPDGVKTPAEVIVPPVAVHVTAEL